jgi:protein-disulfide isomerase
MSFLKSNFDKKPSLVKPILIVLAVILVIGGAYVLGHKNTKNETAEKNSEAKQEVVEINSSGLDKDERVKKVADVEEVIAKWVEANPKAIIASVANMQKKAMEDQVKEAQKTIGTKKDEIFGDKNAPQYSPSGYDMTIVEFFDYSCGYCKKAQATVEELIKGDAKLRVIYKELPILGQASEEMSTVALAVNIIDAKSYKKFHDAMMKTNERGKAAAIKVAKNIGISESKLNEVLKSDKDKIAAMIQENRMLASSIGINGTPGFIIGEELVPGAFELQAFKDKIAAVRSKK